MIAGAETVRDRLLRRAAEIRRGVSERMREPTHAENIAIELGCARALEEYVAALDGAGPPPGAPR